MLMGILVSHLHRLFVIRFGIIILIPSYVGPEILMYLHALSFSLNPRWMRVYGFVWPPWMTSGDEHFSSKNFSQLPSDLTGTVTDAQEVFVILLMNMYAAASLVDSPLTEYWNAMSTIDKPVKPNTATKAYKALNKQYNTNLVNAMAAAFKAFWPTICGQSLTDMTAPLQSVQAIMNGTQTRLKEVRAAGAVPHEWQIHETIPAPPPAMVTTPSTPPPGPTQAPPDPEVSRKRKLDSSAHPDLPSLNGKFLKLVIGADTQEDSEMLSQDVSTVVDIDEEGGYGAGLAYGDSASESGISFVSDNLSDVGDESMPDVNEVEEEKILVPADPSTAKSTTAQPISKLELPVRGKAANVTAPASASSVPSKSPNQTPANPVEPMSRISVSVRDAVPAPPTSSPFYLCGADYASFTPDNTQALLASGDFSSWIATLNNGYVAMEGAWVQSASTSGTTTPPPPQPIAANIHANDEWFQRIQNNGLGIQQILFVGYIDTANSVAQVTALEAQLQFQVASAGIPQTMSLTFSSNASKTSSLGATTASTSPTLEDALSSDYSLMSLGLESSSPPQLTVGQVVTYFGMDYLPVGSAGGLTLPGFDPIGDFVATLDTSPGSRSSLSFKPDVMYSTWLRLRFLILDLDFAAHFNSNFPFLGLVTVSNTAIVAMSTAYCQSGYVGRQVSSQCTLESQIALGSNFSSLSMSVWINFNYANTSFVIMFNDSYSWSEIQGWLVSVIESSGASSPSLDPTSLLPNSSDVSFSVRQITLTLGNPSSTSGYSVQGASITFEVSVYNTIFSLTLDWPGPSITANLWTSIAPDVSTYALLPYIEPYNQYTPLNQPTGEVNFSDFSGSSITPPPGTMNLSPTIYDLSLTASLDSNSNLQYQFNGTVQSLVASSGATTPKLVLGDVDFSFAYASVPGYDVSLTTRIYLVPRDYPTTLASLLNISVEYVDNSLSSTWQVVGTADHISFATIYNLFDADSSDAVMDMLAPLSIPELYVTWDYSSGEADLYANGLLQVGPFGLDLTYQYLHSPAQGQNAWTFSASMGSYSSGISTLGTLIQDLGVDQTVLDALGDVPFVANIIIPAATPGPNTTPPVSLSVSKEPNAETIFWLQVAIATSEGTLSFTFVQLQAARSAPPAGTTSTTPTGFKRIIRVMLDQLPMLPSVPVVGQIQEPVDSIDYIWVGDSTVDNSTSTAGLTLSDITLINNTMSVENQIPYQNNQSALKSSSPGNANSATSNPYVLLAGHHFMVQANGNVILDHIFGQSTTSPTASPQVSRMAVTKATASITASSSKKASTKMSLTKKAATGKKASSSKKTAAGKTTKPNAKVSTVSRIATTGATTTPTAATVDSGSTKAPLSKSVGPLTIQNVSSGRHPQFPLGRADPRVTDWHTNKERLSLYFD